MSTAKPNTAVALAYVFWNPEKASGQYNTDCSTYEQLKAAEDNDMTSCSSVMVVTEDQAKEIVTLCYNETDQELKYHRDVPLRLSLVMFRQADYASVEAASENGAVYDAMVDLTLDQLHENGVTLKAAYASMQATSSMINNEQSAPALVIATKTHNKGVWVSVETDVLSSFLSQDVIDWFMERVAAE